MQILQMTGEPEGIALCELALRGQRVSNDGILETNTGVG